MAPCFLNFISSFGHNPLSNSGDHFFGGFRSLKSFSEPFSKFNALGRSGYHYQLVFEFRTLFRSPSGWNSEYTARDYLEEFGRDGPRGIRRGKNKDNTGTAWRLLPSWLRPRGGHAEEEAATEYTDKRADNPALCNLDQCAIYHHFDVENGKSLWMVTAAESPAIEQLFESGPEAIQRSAFWDVKTARFSTDVLSLSPIDQRFRASLSVLLWLAEWSLSEFGQYITTLDDELQALV